MFLCAFSAVITVLPTSIPVLKLFIPRYTNIQRTVGFAMKWALLKRPKNKTSCVGLEDPFFSGKPGAKLSGWLNDARGSGFFQGRSNGNTWHLKLGKKKTLKKRHELNSLFFCRYLCTCTKIPKSLSKKKGIRIIPPLRQPFWEWCHCRELAASLLLFWWWWTYFWNSLNTKVCEWERTSLAKI